MKVTSTGGRTLFLHGVALKIQAPRLGGPESCIPPSLFSFILLLLPSFLLAAQLYGQMQFPG